MKRNFTAASKQIISAGILSFPVLIAAQTPANSAIPTAPTIAPDTMVLQARDFKQEKDGKVSFTLDGTRLSLSEQWKLLGDDVKRTALVRDGLNAEKTCPYLDISRRFYTIEQMETGKMLFHVVTTASKQEIDMIFRSGCVVTQKPEYSRIRWMINPTTN